MTVYLVGAGPGSPDLLTVRALRLLERADVVLHDALVHPDILAQAVRARRVAVGKRCGGCVTQQGEIHRLMIGFDATYDIVVRLKGGDPMLFARAHEEIVALRAAGVSCEVVPGVTAASAASAALQMPLTRRGDVRNLALITAVTGDGLDRAGMRMAASADAGAIYMGLRQAGKMAAALIALGKPASTPVAMVENASLSTQRCHFTTLGNLIDQTHGNMSAPTVILYGPQFAPASTTVAAPSNTVRASTEAVDIA